MPDVKKYGISQHRGCTKHPKIRFDCPRRRIGREEDLDGAKDVAHENPGDGYVEDVRHGFEPLLSALLENAAGGAPAVEDANNGDESDIEDELHNQTGLDEGEAGADDGVGGVGVKEGGSALSGNGEDSIGDENEEDVKIYRPDGDNRAVGG